MYIVPTAQAQGVNSPLFQSIKSLFGATGGPAGVASLGALITQAVQLMLLIVASIAVIFLMWGGYKYVVSRGNEETAEAAKKTMSSAVWGLVIIVMAYAIISVIAAILLRGEVGNGI